MQSKKAEEKAWRQTYIVDKKQLDSLAKDVPKLFPFSVTVPSFPEKISKLLSESDQAQMKMNKEEALTFQKLSEVTNDINSLRNILKFYDQSNEYLVKVQNSSENILGKLQTFRGKMAMAYEELADSEDALNDQLELLNKKIEAVERGEDVYDQKENLKNNNREVKVWEKEKDKKSSQEQITEERGKLNDLEEKMREKEREVNTIQKVIASLGKNLGWPEQDHKDFVSIWHRGPTAKNYFQIEEELQSYFALYTAEQIQQHMNRYIKMRKLTEEKKDLIVEYKNLKEARKMEELRGLQLERERSREQREKQEQRRKNEKQQLEMKAKVTEWKEVKLKEQHEEQQKKQKEEKMKKQDSFARKREAEERNRQLLDRWKKQQTQKKQEDLRRIKSAKKSTPIDPQAEERIRLREELLLQKKLQLINDKRREEEMQRAKESRLKEEKFVKFSHVGVRLDQKTTAIKEKERSKFDGKEKKEANTFGGQLLMTGIRATPSWMK